MVLESQAEILAAKRREKTRKMQAAGNGGRDIGKAETLKGGNRRRQKVERRGLSAVFWPMGSD